MSLRWFLIMVNKPPASKPTALKLVSSKAKPREDDLPLDDRRWLPLILVHKRLAEYEGSPELAAFKLNMALLNEEVRCKWVATTAYGQGLVPGRAWSEHQLSCGPEGVRIILTPPRDDTNVTIVQSASLVAMRARLPKSAPTPPELSPQEQARKSKRLSETVFFVWQPDIRLGGHWRQALEAGVKERTWKSTGARGPDRELKSTGNYSSPRSFTECASKGRRL